MGLSSLYYYSWYPEINLSASTECPGISIDEDTSVNFPWTGICAGRKRWFGWILVVLVAVIAVIAIALAFGLGSTHQSSEFSMPSPHILPILSAPPTSDLTGEDNVKLRSDSNGDIAGENILTRTTTTTRIEPYNTISYVEVHGKAGENDPVGSFDKAAILANSTPVLMVLSTSSGVHDITSSVVSGSNLNTNVIQEYETTTSYSSHSAYSESDDVWQSDDIHLRPATIIHHVATINNTRAENMLKQSKGSKEDTRTPRYIEWCHMNCDCSSKSFTCNHETKWLDEKFDCLPTNLICDGMKQCDNGLDEGHCIGLIQLPILSNWNNGKKTFRGSEGYVVVRINGTWHPYCSKTWTGDHYRTICRQVNLGYLFEVDQIDLNTFYLLTGFGGAVQLGIQPKLVVTHDHHFFNIYNHVGEDKSVDIFNELSCTLAYLKCKV